MVAPGSNYDRWFLVQLYRWFPSVLEVLTIIRPETLLRWHRAGFRLYEAPRVKRLFRGNIPYFLPFKGLTRAQVCIDGTDGPLLGRDERSTPGARRGAPEGARG